jgi:hypothetical protein
MKIDDNKQTFRMLYERMMKEQQDLIEVEKLRQKEMMRELLYLRRKVRVSKLST